MHQIEFHVPILHYEAAVAPIQTRPIMIASEVVNPSVEPSQPIIGASITPPVGHIPEEENRVTLANTSIPVGHQFVVHLLYRAEGSPAVPDYIGMVQVQISNEEDIPPAQYPHNPIEYAIVQPIDVNNSS